MLTNEQEKRAGYLQNLCNKYGDFKVAIVGQDKDGNKFWSKHRSVMECWETEDGFYFLANANNRTAHPHELILDFDGETAKEKAKICYQNLKKHNLQIKTYFSGSRGYHVHITIPNINTAPQKFLQFIAELAGADTQVVQKHHMIAIENCPHWKTGNPKTEVKFDE
jgi:hypothetical protein